VLVRQAILIVALLFIAALLVLTIHAVSSGGFDILTVLSLLVLGMFAFGIVGALLHPPEE
jgi:hypothetical protein